MFLLGLLICSFVVVVVWVFCRCCLGLCCLVGQLMDGMVGGKVGWLVGRSPVG